MSAEEPELLREAMALHQGGQADAALGHYDRILAARPDAAKVLNVAAVAAFQAGDPARAVGYLERLAAVTPEDPSAHNSLGVALQRLGDLDRAEAAFRAALRLNPEFAEAYNNLGSVAAAKGDDAAAIAAYKKAIELKSDYAEAFNNLALRLLAMGRGGPALEAAKRAVQLAPGFVAGHVTLARVHKALGRHGAALGHLGKAMRLDPAEIRIRFDFSEALADVVPAWHFAMMNDQARNQAYARAIQAAVRPGLSVLEIGTGSGLLAMLAARAGADHVTTCEQVPEIAHKARQIIAANGLTDRITVVDQVSTALKVGGRDLPRPADLVISEILSNELIGEGVLEALRDARARLMAPAGVMIPAAGAVVVALVGGQGLADLWRVTEVEGFDLSAFNEFSPKKLVLPAGVRPRQRLSEAHELFRFGFREDRIGPREQRDAAITATTAGTVVGLVQWVRVDLDAASRFENDPFAGAGSHWGGVFYRFATPKAVAAGETVTVRAIRETGRLFVDAVDAV